MHMSAESTEPGHGNSPAAWTAVAIMLIAFVIGTLAFWFELVWLVWASAALVLVGLLVGYIMKRAGYGVGGARYNPKAH
jgi:hydrogenase-4 membrane subunit HyfE